MTLLSVTAVEASANLHFWADSSHTKDITDISGTGGNTWTFTCTGQNFIDWGVVNNGYVYFLPYIGDNGDHYCKLGSYSAYENSGDYKDFNSDNSGNAGLHLPTDYASKTFTFYLSNYSKSDDGKYYIRVTISWVDGASNIQLKSTLDSWQGTASDSYSNSEYSWEWDSSDLAGRSNNERLEFFLFDPGSSTSYGAGASEQDMTSYNDWFSCTSSNTTKFYITHAVGYKYTIKAKNDNGTWKVKVEKQSIPTLKSTLDNFAGTAPESESNGVYTWTWSLSDLASVNNNTKLKFYLTQGSTDWGSSSSSGTDLTNSSSWNDCQTISSTDYDFYVTHTLGIKYTISAQYVSGEWQIKVEKITPPIQLKSTVDDWNGKNPDGESDGVYSWTWTRKQLEDAGYTNGQSLEFKLFDSGTWYGAEGAHDTKYNLDQKKEGEYYVIPTSNNKANFYVEYIRGASYTIKAKQVNSQWNILIEASYPTYYWVSPEVTNNQKLSYFKMVPSRNRNQDGGNGKISGKYFTFTIKDDDLKKWSDVDVSSLNDGDDIRWYIVRDDNAYWYRPTASTHHTGHGNPYQLTAANDGKDLTGDFYTYNYTNIGTSENRDTYFSFDKGAEKSYTFVLNSSPSSSSNSTGNVYVDSPIISGDTSKEYYLVGNFTNATGSVSIDISPESGQVDNWRKLMTKNVYTHTNPDNSEVTDSIVYVVDVTKPTQGWGDLYVDISPTDNSGSDEEMWGNVYRPLMNLFNNLDGRALVGGLTKVGNTKWEYPTGKWNTGYQSINPAPSEFYSSYTFRFNATTMTYNLKFHTSLYLIGPAVSESSSTDGSWEIGTSAIRLQATQDEKHFRNKVYLRKGQPFRFVVKEDNAPNPDFAKNFGEDSFAPTWATGDNAAAYPHYAGTDTQYRNYLSYNSGSGTRTENGSDIIFDLPDGYYTINFYDYGENSYYTIEREAELRDFKNVHYTSGSTNEDRNIIGRGDYQFFRVWSDYIAWNKPDDVDVFVVTEFTKTGNRAATITLTKQEDIKYIPANTGVILAMKTDENSLKGGMYYKTAENTTAYNNAWMQMTPYEKPDATVTDKGVLTPLYEAKNLQRYNSVTQKYNYLFGFYRANKVNSTYSGPNNDFYLGFWLTTGVGSTYANSAFLQIDKDVAEALGLGASYNATPNATGAPAFLLSFEDDEDPTVTGIVDVDKDVTSPTYKAVNDNWYTIQGVRIDAPTTKGIYIHGGKKVIVR